MRLVAAALAVYLPTLVLGDIFSLSELQWTLKNANNSIIIRGSVPSQAHLDLSRAGVITEPLLGINGSPLILNSNVPLLINCSTRRLHAEMDS